MESIKTVVIGDGGAGKTCLCLSFTQDKFYGEYVPTVFDNYAVTMLGKPENGESIPINLGLWDTAGQEEYDRLRPLSYPGTDAFVVVFSLTSQTSLNNVRTRWLPELKRFAPDKPFVLVGTKKDLIDNPSYLKELENNSTLPLLVKSEEAQELADTQGAAAYIETSALTQENVKETFELIVQKALTRKLADLPGTSRRRRRAWRTGGCSVM